jgi:hypothetical protein
VKLLIVPSPYPVPGAALHPHFDAHLIYPNKCLPIFNSKMSMALGKLKTMLPVEFLKKGSASSYSMMVAQVCESVLELCNANVKLEILNNGHDR